MFESLKNYIYKKRQHYDLERGRRYYEKRKKTLTKEDIKWEKSQDKKLRKWYKNRNKHSIF